MSGGGLARVLDLDDVIRCPTATSCAACEATADLVVCTAGTPVGVYCATLCRKCLTLDRLPKPESWTAAIHAVLEHCEHLDCHADDMAAALAAEDGQ